jgi:hypothetical protein
MRWRTSDRLVRRIIDLEMISKKERDAALDRGAARLNVREKTRRAESKFKPRRRV